MTPIGGFCNSRRLPSYRSKADADTLERAKLALSAAQDQKRTSVTASDRSVAEARLHDAQAAVAVARHRVDLSVIKAPIAGTVYQLGDGTGSGDIKVGTYLTPAPLSLSLARSTR